MEWRLLRSFQVLARQGNFGRAARALQLSQPALTMQIRRLEAEVGAPLFDRGRHGARLTPLGARFAEEVAPLLHMSEEVLDRARRAARGEMGVLRLGFGIATRLLVPRLVSRFRREHPQVQVVLRDMPSPIQLDALEQGTLDVGFVRLPVQRPLSLLPVVEDRLVLAVPSGRSAELARRPKQDLRDEAFVVLSPDRSPNYHGHVLAVCRRYGFSPRIVQSASEFFTVLALVAAGMGIAVVPSGVTATRVEGVGFVALGVPEARWRVGAAWVGGGRHPVRDAFLSLLRAELARQETRARTGPGP
ncbi:MAG TPA: LysR family transcriptional regulator [Anaeromyxobacteraceae bacterium]|nr:LysR family transcriptional regulator [Anaeromyxobacteraceae bacterium]